MDIDKETIVIMLPGTKGDTKDPEYKEVAMYLVEEGYTPLLYLGRSKDHIIAPNKAIPYLNVDFTNTCKYLRKKYPT